MLQRKFLAPDAVKMHGESLTDSPRKLLYTLARCAYIRQII